VWLSAVFHATAGIGCPEPGVGYALPSQFWTLALKLKLYVVPLDELALVLDDVDPLVPDEEVVLVLDDAEPPAPEENTELVPVLDEAPPPVLDEEVVLAPPLPPVPPWEPDWSMPKSGKQAPDATSTPTAPPHAPARRSDARAVRCLSDRCIVRASHEVRDERGRTAPDTKEAPEPSPLSSPPARGPARAAWATRASTTAAHAPVRSSSPPKREAAGPEGAACSDS
jgi:hypothetical protein